MQAGLITAERPNLVGLGAKLMEQLESKRDFIATDSSLSMVPHDLGHNLVLDGVGDFGINSIAHGQIASKLGIPKAYYDRMQAEAPELLADNANHWFENSDAKRMVRTLHQDARALLSDRFRPLDNANVLDAIAPMIADLEIKSCEVTDSRMYITGVSPRLRGDVKVGDAVQGGITISNSEVGMGTLSFAFFMYRLVCLNGMVTEAPFKQIHLGKSNSKGLDLSSAREWFSEGAKVLEDATFYKQMSDVVGHMLSEDYFGQMLEKMKGATERVLVGKVEPSIKEITKTAGLSQNESGDLLRHLAEGGDLSAWGVSNAITRLAHDADSFDRNMELQREGGKIIELGASDWKRIAEAA